MWENNNFDVSLIHSSPFTHLGGTSEHCTTILNLKAMINHHILEMILSIAQFTINVHEKKIYK